jgi:hypothetical protein
MYSALTVMGCVVLSLAQLASIAGHRGGAPESTAPSPRQPGIGVRDSYIRDVQITTDRPVSDRCTFHQRVHGSLAEFPPGFWPFASGSRFLPDLHVDTSLACRGEPSVSGARRVTARSLMTRQQLENALSAAGTLDVLNGGVLCTYQPLVGPHAGAVTHHGVRQECTRAIGGGP